WPSTGTTTVSPRNSGREPSSSNAATINPQTAMVTGLASTARTDVTIATAAPTSRSSSSGKDTTLIISTSTANRKRTALPTTTRFQPARVVNTSWANWLNEAGGA